MKRKLLGVFAALGLTLAVLAVTAAPAPAGLQASGYPGGPLLSGYAPVWQGSNSNYSSGVVVDIKLSDAAQYPQAPDFPQAVRAYIRGYDDNVFSNADTVCVKVVYWNINYPGQLFNGIEECMFNIPEGNTQGRNSWGGLYASGNRAFGACYKTWPDGAPLNGREWCNTVLG